jgi:hypothetical protein
VLLAIAGIAFVLARKRGEQAGELVSGEASSSSTDATSSATTTSVSAS